MRADNSTTNNHACSGGSTNPPTDNMVEFELPTTPRKRDRRTYEDTPSTHGLASHITGHEECGSLSTSPTTTLTSGPSPETPGKGEVRLKEPFYLSDSRDYEDTPSRPDPASRAKWRDGAVSLQSDRGAVLGELKIRPDTVEECIALYNTLAAIYFPLPESLIEQLTRDEAEAKSVQSSSVRRKEETVANRASGTQPTPNTTTKPATAAPPSPTPVPVPSRPAAIDPSLRHRHHTALSPAHAYDALHFQHATRCVLLPCLPCAARGTPCSRHYPACYQCLRRGAAEQCIAVRQAEHEDLSDMGGEEGAVKRVPDGGRIVVMRDWADDAAQAQAQGARSKGRKGKGAVAVAPPSRWQEKLEAAEALVQDMRARADRANWAPRNPVGAVVAAAVTKVEVTRRNRWSWWLQQQQQQQQQQREKKLPEPSVVVDDDDADVGEDLSPVLKTLDLDALDSKRFSSEEVARKWRDLQLMHGFGLAYTDLRPQWGVEAPATGMGMAAVPLEEVWRESAWSEGSETTEETELSVVLVRGDGEGDGRRSSV